MGKLYINVCGETRVRNENGDLIEKLGGVKPRQVLEILALSVGRPMSKDRIAQLLWDGEPPPSYVGTLESYVCILRRALGAKGRDSALQTTTTGYVLRSELAWVDVVEAQSMLSQARVAPAAERVTLVESALALLDGELLSSEPYAPWAGVQRAAHERELVALCTDAAESVLELNDTGLARRIARFVTQRDPLAERAWQVQIRALGQEGRQAEALNTYARLRAVMQDELGAEPSSQSRHLYEDVLHIDADHSREPSDHRELSTLIRLLRQALESLPGIQVPEHDAKLTELAVRVLSAA